MGDLRPNVRLNFWRVLLSSVALTTFVAHSAHEREKPRKPGKSALDASKQIEQQIEKTVGNRYDFSPFYSNEFENYSKNKSDFANPNNAEPSDTRGNYNSIAQALSATIDKLGCEDFSSVVKSAGEIISFRGPGAFGKGKNASRNLRNMLWSVLQNRYPRSSNAELYDLSNDYLSTIFDMYINLKTAPATAENAEPNVQAVNASIDKLISNFETRIKDLLASKKMTKLQRNMLNCKNPVSLPEKMVNANHAPEKVKTAETSTDHKVDATKEGLAQGPKSTVVEDVDPLDIPVDTHSGSSVAQHEAIVSEYISRSVKSLACPNNRNVILHNGMKMARLLAEYEKNGAIVMGDNDKSGINYVLKQNILSWCKEDQRFSDDNTDKCLQRYFAPMKELTAYLYTGMKKKYADSLPEGSLSMDEHFKNEEVKDPASQLNLLLDKIAKLPTEIEGGKKKINIKCSTAKKENPYSHKRVDSIVEGEGKYDKERKPKVIPFNDPRPAFSTEIKTSIPKITAEMKNGTELAKAHGYYTYSGKLSYARPHILWNIRKAAAALAVDDIVLGVGDMSKEGGGDVPTHKTHEDGKAVDLRLVFATKDGGGRARSGNQSELTPADIELNFKAVKALIDVDPRNVQMILVNNSVLQDKINKYLKEQTGDNSFSKKIGKTWEQIKGKFVCHDCPGHENHIHFEWRE
jgi:hypothetical protein